MSLKEQTAEKHRLAEQTPFMKAVFKQTLPREVWKEWTYWKSLFYYAIETKCKDAGLLTGIEDIQRTESLTLDYREMGVDPNRNSINHVLAEYIHYIGSLDPNKALAHLYTWHMGDMFGGQMIKKIVEGPHNSLEFKDPQTIIASLRSKLTDDLGQEANVAFDWAIKLMNELYHE